MQKRDQVVLAALVIGLLVGAAATYALAGNLRHTSTTTATLPAVTSTTTATITSTETTASISAQTTALTTTSTSYALLPATCASSDSSYFTQPGAGTLVVGGSSPAIVCLQLYDFNLTSPIVLNTTSLLAIWGPSGTKVTALDGNFTLTTSQDELTIGGPSDLNEGTIVAYSISAKPGASGIYFLSVNGWNVSLNDGNGPASGFIGDVIAGTGSPTYVGPLGGSYQGYQPTTPFSIPGFNYSHLIPNDLYFKMVDALNSTQ